MKALILAAGFGTRLSPHTDRLPKALFPVAGTPVLGRMIANLKRAGCTAIAVNAHHLAGQIADYLDKTDFGLPIELSIEKQILGTGGAIRRLADFLGDAPFLMVNADIVTDIDLASVYRHHEKHPAPATLVMHDREPFNQVGVTPSGQVTGFQRLGDRLDPAGTRKLAFTGIQVIDPAVIEKIPSEGFCDIISVYHTLIHEGDMVRARVVKNHYWQDMGTLESYREAVVDALAPELFDHAFGTCSQAPIQSHPLAGDGSDRRWFRLQRGQQSLILADHGITMQPAGSEVAAFASIGDHLHKKGLPVPRQVGCDRFSGLVFVEDLGDLNLQQWVGRQDQEEAIEAGYRQVIDTWLGLTTKAATGFDPAWTCQSPAYDEALILDKECRYFMEAFVNGYLGHKADYEELAGEFGRLARATIRAGTPGLIHRDLQSRNIMVCRDRFCMIDFQGARNGPVQYDLASLLIDPYVALGSQLSQRLLNYAAKQATIRFETTPEAFHRGYCLCRVTRNLQMLGAFGFLSRVKQKKDFERWIPTAAAMLPGHLAAIEELALPRLTALADAIANRFPAS